jgi:hypothetical protein
MSGRWPLLALLAVVAISAHSQVSVLTQHNDNYRTGQNTNETVLTPANVNQTQFGKLFSQAVDGYVYAQPLYVPNVTIPGLGTHNVVYVATEHDSVYAFDADTNAGANAVPLWHTSFIDPAHGITTVSSGDVGCGDLIPEIGITGTPAIDISGNTMYVLAKTKESGIAVQRLHALDITTGAEKFGGPVKIKANASGTGDGGTSVIFNPLREGQRPGLLLQNGKVYIAWASHCDITPYHGWVIAYNAQTLTRTGVWNSTPNGGLGGIWESGAGIAADASNFVYVPSGNGTFDANFSGKDYGDSVIKIGFNAKGKLRPFDYFTPYDQNYLNNTDLDLGSGGALLLPDMPGAKYPDLLVQAGKEGTVYVIDRTHMGHFNPSNNNQIVQNIPGAVGGMWAAPVFWNNHVYFGGADDAVKMFNFDPSTGLLATTPASNTLTFFGFPGPTPSISANGNSNGILWAIQTDRYNINGLSILHAYDATNLATELYNSAQNPSRDGAGGAVKFSVPTVAKGKVYVGAVQQLSVYGLLPGR